MSGLVAKQRTIIHLIPGLYLGGAEKVLEIIAIHQTSKGHLVYVVTFEQSGFESFFPSLKILTINVQYQDSLVHHRGIRVGEYEELIDKLKPDFIHSHSYWTDLISHQFLRKNIQYISHFHLCYEFFNKVYLRKISLKHLYQWIDRYRLLKKYEAPNCGFLASSDFIASFYRQNLPGHLVKKLRVINNPIDTAYFLTGKGKVKYDLLTIGRLEEVKNHKFLLNLMRALKTRGINCQMAIVGEGGLRNHLETLINLYDLVNEVHLLGAVKDLREIFSISNFYIHASHAETFGLSIFEAMAAGLPVIVKKFVGFNERTLIDRFNSIVIPDEDIEAFIHAIDEVKSNGTLKEALISGGLLTTKKFAKEIYLENIDEFYNR